MGILDTLKAKLNKETVADLAQKHGDRIDQGLDKVAKTVDEKTKGKYSDQIRTGTGKAKDAMDRLAGPAGQNGPESQDIRGGQGGQGAQDTQGAQGAQGKGGSQDGGDATPPSPPAA